MDHCDIVAPDVRVSGVVTRKETLFAKLPPEARSQAKKDVDAGLYKNSEEWAKVYFG